MISMFSYTASEKWLHEIFEIEIEIENFFKHYYWRIQMWDTTATWCGTPQQPFALRQQCSLFIKLYAILNFLNKYVLPGKSHQTGIHWYILSPQTQGGDSCPFKINIYPFSSATLERPFSKTSIQQNFYYSSWEVKSWCFCLLSCVVLDSIKIFKMLTLKPKFLST